MKKRKRLQILKNYLKVKNKMEKSLILSLTSILLLMISSCEIPGSIRPSYVTCIDTRSNQNQNNLYSGYYYPQTTIIGEKNGWKIITIIDPNNLSKPDVYVFVDPKTLKELETRCGNDSIAFVFARKEPRAFKDSLCTWRTINSEKDINKRPVITSIEFLKYKQKNKSCE